MVPFPFKAEAESWSRGRNPFGRGVLLLLLAWILLGRAGLLRQDRLLGGMVRLCGLLAMGWRRLVGVVPL